MSREPNIVEIVTLTLKADVSPEAFAKIDRALEDQHVSRQPGFVSRETAASGQKWLVIVHWESAEAAQASMDSFANAPAAAQFMGMVDASTMTMTRYEIIR